MLQSSIIASTRRKLKKERGCSCCWIAQDLRSRTFRRFDAALLPIMTMAVAAGLVRLAVWCIKVCAWLWCESPMPRAAPSNEQWLHVQKCAVQTLHPKYQFRRTCELVRRKSSWCNMPVIGNIQHSCQNCPHYPGLTMTLTVFVHAAYKSIVFNSPTVANPKSVQNWQILAKSKRTNGCKPIDFGAVPSVSVHHK